MAGPPAEELEFKEKDLIERWLWEYLILHMSYKAWGYQIRRHGIKMKVRRIIRKLKELNIKINTSTRDSAEINFATLIMLGENGERIIHLIAMEELNKQ